MMCLSKLTSCGLFVIALIAAIFGFGGLAEGAADIAKILFFGFLVVALTARGRNCVPVRSTVAEPLRPVPHATWARYRMRPGDADGRAFAALSVP